MRILFVDDNTQVAEMFGLCFNLAGHIAQCVDSGAEALKAVELNTVPFDVAIVDYHMPEMDGLETARRLRLITNIPILMFTGDCSADIEGQAHKAGIAHVVYKPLTPDQLLSFARQVAGGFCG